MPSRHSRSPTSRRIYVADVGSTLNDAFGWAGTKPGSPEVWGSRSIEALVVAMAADLRKGVSVALGLEAPLFLPIPEDARNLSRGRDGDKDRSCLAPAGGYVAALSLHQVAWILQELRKSCGSICFFSVDPSNWYPREGPPVLFCWEAFVSKEAHAPEGHLNGHVADAATAARFFAEHEERLKEVSAVTAESPLSLIGAVALWSGWSTDLALLATPTVVLRPAVPYEGPIGEMPVSKK